MKRPNFRLRRAALFVFTLLAIECLDEFVFGAKEAAWPFIRTDLHLSYDQIGLLLSVPGIFAALIEPGLGILGDVWKRRLLILGGGVMFTVGLLLTAASNSFGLLFLATVLIFPASGAFVGLSQSTLMDIDPSRHEQNMARWTLAGSVGVIAGATSLGVAVTTPAGWRWLFIGMAVLSLLLVLLARSLPFAHHTEQGEAEHVDLREAFKVGLSGIWEAFRRPEVLRWLVLTECADFLLDVLYGYLALYFVDVVGVSPEQATLAVAIWTAVSLLGDFLIIHVLERIEGLRYVRISAFVELILFPAFLLLPGWLPKLICMGLVALANSGWYAILQGNLYSSMPGQSGTVFSLGSISGMFRGLVPLLIGILAERFGLGVAIWLLMLGPITLLVGVPRRANEKQLEPTLNEG